MCLEADLDRALTDSYSVLFRLGLFDPVADQYFWSLTPDVVGSAESKATSLLMAQESLVLLQNRERALPFSRGRKLAVLGPHYAAQYDLLGSVNYLGDICEDRTYKCFPSLLDALRTANAGGDTVGASGCQVIGDDRSGFAAALDLAKQADYVVLAMGLNTTVENESNDRRTIGLPGVQADFVRAALALGKPTVIVLLNGGQVALDADVIAAAPAILEAWFPGPYGGTAIASVLFGAYNPGGKMPLTVYPASYVDDIKMSDMSMTEGVGRSYKYYKGTPLWPFGFGLSYTTFQYDVGGPAALHVDLGAGADLDYTVTVTNTGAVAGDAVVMAYFVPDPSLAAPKPFKQLYAYKRVALAAGASARVVFRTQPSACCALTTEPGHKYLRPGAHRLMFTDGNGRDGWEGFVNVSMNGAPMLVKPFAPAQRQVAQP